MLGAAGRWRWRGWCCRAIGEELEASDGGERREARRGGRGWPG